jgi:hypothetical protein
VPLASNICLCSGPNGWQIGAKLVRLLAGTT